MLWGITSYFNPVGCRRRLLNYRVFRKRLQVPLVAVECSFGRGFELRPQDAEILIQIPEGDVMWQKERLLNVALQALPAEVTAVAWIDCDVLLQKGWAEQAVDVLRDNTLIHLFRDKHQVPQDGDPLEFDIAGVEPLAQSTVHLINTGQTGHNALNEPAIHTGRSHGLAWAARRDLLDRHGLYDACIIGGADKAILGAALGAFTEIGEALQLLGAHFEHYLEWARPFHTSTGGRVAALDGAIVHLWHGTVAGRGHEVRHRTVAELGLDPRRDLALTSSGSWRWNSDRPELHNYLRDYFVSRNEDGAPVSRCAP